MAAVTCPRCEAESAGFFCACGMVLRPAHEAKQIDVAAASKPPLPPPNAFDEPARPLPTERGTQDSDPPAVSTGSEERQVAHSKRAGQNWWGSDGTIGAAISLAALLGLIGFGIGNWHPVWGDFLAKSLAEPLSPARVQLGYEHAVAGAVLGLILGALGARGR